MKSLKRISIVLLLMASVSMRAQEGFPDDDVDDVPTAPISNGVYPMLFIGVVLGYVVWKKQQSATPSH